ncbi:MAG TPA: hypothetical protein VNV66_07895, partial [Pilimelia sp.]|nr:hypothetical protein [Pilimelia sp.]
VQAVTGAPGARRGAVPGTGAPADRGTGDPPTGTDLLARDAAPADPASPVHPAGGLAGSVLSPATWRQAIEFLRERTVRR